ncbi:hypothetical protein [Priestia endophytica]|uniref:hypothetical protein n=1 Tax=Priestia endophytica TaxID=135735 RepID=UPI003D2C28AD
MTCLGINYHWKWFDGGSVEINSSNGTTLTLDLSSILDLNDIKEIIVEIYLSFF